MRLELDKVSHVYAAGTRSEKAALHDVSVSVESGEMLGIVGGTGSGKSTLAQHLNLLLEPTSGRVLADGVDAATLNRSELRRRVGLVFQFPEQALFAPTVEEDVGFAPRQIGLETEETGRRVREALAALSVEHLSSRAPHALSGGERRRVAIAGVLAMRPEVLVLDEPTAGLDPAARRDLLQVLRNIWAGGGSVVLVSHDLDEVAEVADRVCALEDGSIRALGTPAEVFYSEPGLRPETVRVASRVGERAPEVGRPVTYEQTLRSLGELLESREGRG
ncbi:ATP-binding cassette domain-containing protein [Rubrobacter aplysinae]|uniref:ATP-binding cassette domain-containing protein n=1 Tax=Rubrobacter aplysinae TaxID=909625 RepID=UPI00064C21F4|nr:ATP-binding cassette domain-containing protein [Rubrobacter aplysinae]